jgi:cytoskeleton protein RodZ
VAVEASTPARSLNVGTVLRQTRETLGEDVRLCASHLRIREPYLRAIEDSRFEDLPGRAYAVGFVRAYAIHLGLDGDKVVEQFKAESSGNAAAPELVVPEPAPESGMPGGTLLAASVLLAATAYGGWYYMSTQSRLVTEAPTIDLPTRPAPMVPRPQLATRPTAPAPAAPAAAISPQGQAASSFSVGPGAVAPIARPTAMPQVAPPVAGLPATGPTVSAAASEDADEAETEAPPAPEPLRPSTATAAPQPSSPPAAGPADASTRDAVARPPISASSAIAATLTDAQRQGLSGSGGPSRVVIRAIADSWLQVGDGRGPALFAQVLRAGDSYHVPDRPGLRFDTGNAGGLEITVDGRPVPSVGPSGSVRRNIPLDADKLVAGAFGQR